MESQALTQCLVVLFEVAPEVAALRERLSRYPVTAEGSRGFVVSLRPEQDGELRVESFAAPFPDDAPPDVWAAEPFGPRATRGALARAVQHAWTFADAETLTSRHRAFVRIGAATAAAESPTVTLLAATELASALCELPGALCVFNPAGEVLRSPDDARASLRDCGAQQLPPLELWANVRIFQLADTGWVVMDTIGMAQLGVTDHEACFASDTYDFEAVDQFLRNTTYSEWVARRRMTDGDAVDGPGELRGSRAMSQVLPGSLATTSARPGSLPWRGRTVAEGLGQPRRQVVRWVPLDGRTPPARVEAR